LPAPFDGTTSPVASYHRRVTARSLLVLWVSGAALAALLAPGCADDERDASSGGATSGSSSRAASGSGSGGGGSDECMIAADDCRLFSSYCDAAPCVCFALAAGAPDPVCAGDMVNCRTDPCDAVTLDCLDGSCTMNGGEEGIPCQTDEQCAEGLKCCYPCGMPDCLNRCTAVEPGGDCPLIP
jgi:hypothetical protein